MKHYLFVFLTASDHWFEIMGKHFLKNKIIIMVGQNRVKCLLLKASIKLDLKPRYSILVIHKRLLTNHFILLGKAHFYYEVVINSP